MSPPTRRVRAALVQKQRELLSDGDWVAEGRDIGTVVAPDAELKIFLTASPEARAMPPRDRAGHRLAHRAARTRRCATSRTATAQHSPLRAAVDAIELDTTDRTVEDVTGQIVGLVRKLAAKR